METKNYPNFEAVKISMRQDRSGYILTLVIHPDEVPDAVMRDFVGSRYQVVMVRLNDDQLPINRNIFKDPVKTAGILCKDPMFHKFLLECGHIFDPVEEEAVNWLRETLQILSRSELKDNKDAATKLFAIHEDYITWKHQNV